MHSQKLKCYLNYLKQDPNNTRLILDIVHCYWELGEFDIAIHHLKTLIAKDNTNATLIGQLSLLYLDSNALSLAEITAQKALILDAQNYEGLLVQIFLQLQKEQNPSASIDDLLVTHAHEPRLWFAKGLTAMLEKNCLAAEKAFENTLQLHPHFYDCLIALSLCQLLQDNAEQSLTNYEKARTINPRLSDAWGGLALAHALKKDTIEAKALFKTGLSLNNNCFYSRLAESLVKK